MISIIDIEAAFPDLCGLKSLAPPSGQKDVYGATQNGNQVVLKLVKPVSGSEKRFAREIDAAASLEREFVPRILDHGVTSVNGESRHYLIEEFIPGAPLSAILVDQAVQGLPFALDLIKHLLEACAEFEKAQLVHRNLKPANIIIDVKGKPRVIDFGIVRYLDRTSLTPSGTLAGVGTVGYGAPEQFRNEKPNIDSRSDLYSIGVIAYEVLSGQNPFRIDATDAFQIYQRQEKLDLDRLTIPGDDQGELSDFIGVLSQRFPSRRVPTAAQALEWFIPVYDKLR